MLKIDFKILIKLFFLGLIILFVDVLVRESPHREAFKLDYAHCPTTGAGIIDIIHFSYDHDATNFELEGTHEMTLCVNGHPSLNLKEALSKCLYFQADVHNMNLGNESIRHHTTETLLVNNFPELNKQNGFPLITSHAKLSCLECHDYKKSKMDDEHQFKNGNINDSNACYSCHQDGREYDLKMYIDIS